MKCVTSRNPKTADEICRKKNSPWQWSIVHYMSLRAFFAVLCNCCWPQHSTTLQTRKMCVITFQLFHTIRTKTIFVYEFYTFWQKEILFSIPCFAYNFLFFIYNFIIQLPLSLYKKNSEILKTRKKKLLKKLENFRILCKNMFYLILPSPLSLSHGRRMKRKFVILLFVILQLQKKTPGKSFPFFVFVF